jgi:hypothetical protein
MARNPDKLMNDDLINEFINYIKVGNYVNTACAAVGIGEATYYKWMRTGLEVEEVVSAHKDEEDLRARMEEGELVLGFNVIQVRSWNVRREISKATAMGEAYAVAMVRSQMPNQWAAAMTFLERRHPGKWKRREQIDIGQDEQVTGIDESLLLQDPKAVKMLHEALEMAAKGRLPAGEEPAVIDAEVIQDDNDPASAS